jgi:hypothetical protein
MHSMGVGLVLGLYILMAQFRAVESSKLRMWLDKNHFVTGKEPISGQTAVQIGGKLYFISGTHGSGAVTTSVVAKENILNSLVAKENVIFLSATVIRISF